MKIQLAENIRRFRKARHLTQEQLAEALGVTVSAVSKWESGATAPELGMLTDLAAFFEQSVDVLLGYGWEKGSMGDAVAHIKALCKEYRFAAATAYGETAIQKYPNAFAVIHECAEAYYLGGLVQQDKGALNRSLELFRRALELLPQNTDPEIGELTIQKEMAEITLSLGDWEGALEQLRAINYGGRFTGEIGWILSSAGRRHKEALEPLSEALVRTVMELYRICVSYYNVCYNLENFQECLFMAQWNLGWLQGLIQPGTITYLDKCCALVYAVCALAQGQLGNWEAAEKSLEQARARAVAFDKAPSHKFRGIRFYHSQKPATAYDNSDDKGSMENLDTLFTENAVNPAGKRILEIWEEMNYEKA